MPRFFPIVALGFAVLLGACASKPVVDPNSPAANFSKAAAQAAQRGDAKEAMRLYNLSLTENKENPEALKGLAALQEVSGDANGARDSYKKAVELDGKDNAARRAYARLLIAQNNPMEAKKQFEAAIDNDEKDLKARVGLGVAFDHLRQHDKAQAQYRAVLAREGGELGAINNLAYSTILAGRYDQAIPLLEARLGNPGMTPAMRQNLALAYGLSGDDKNAERIAKIDLRPAQVAENLAFYKKRRAELAAATPPSLALGPFPTLSMAEIRATEATKLLQKAKIAARAQARTEMPAANGTPRFVIRFDGPTTAPLSEKETCAALRPLQAACGLMAGG